MKQGLSILIHIILVLVLIPIVLTLFKLAGYPGTTNGITKGETESRAFQQMLHHSSQTEP